MTQEKFISELGKDTKSDREELKPGSMRDELIPHNSAREPGSEFRPYSNKKPQEKRESAFDLIG